MELFDDAKYQVVPPLPRAGAFLRLTRIFRHSIISDGRIPWK
jgi:hypothetical protein